MQDGLTQEEIEILDAARRVICAEIPKYKNEKYYATVPRELFSIFGDHGLTGITVSEEFGGLGKGVVFFARLMEEMASVDLGPAIFVSVHLMVCGLIQRFGTDAQKKKYLPGMAAGKLLGAFALTEPSAGSDAAALTSEAKSEGGGFVLNGEKCYISSAGWADLYVVFARTKSGDGEGISAFIVEKEARGMTISKPEKKMGCELSPISSLTFANVKLSKEALLGPIHKGFAIARSGLAGGRVTIAACANGISSAALERSIQHLKERKQFGQRLIEFQGLQFMLADMKTKLEAARLLTAEAALRVQNAPPGAAENLHPSMAKCFATDSAMSITTDAVQLLGGAGYIEEYQVEGLMRAAKMLQIVEGTNQIQRVIIARELMS